MNLQINMFNPDQVISYQGTSKVRIGSHVISGCPERVQNGQGFLENILGVDAQFLQQGWLVNELVVHEVLLVVRPVRRVQGSRGQVGHPGGVGLVASGCVVSIKT